VQVQDAQGRAQWITPVQRNGVPSADPVSQTTEWRMELANKDSAGLLPGQQVRVRFTPAQAGNVSSLVLPPAAIVRRSELTAVYLVSGKGFVLRAVRLGASQGADGVEVLAGVSVGDVVALDPIRAGFANAVPATVPK
jgi:multidrug efflux pump subunit AcrA (membrane-fusion protein)